MNQEKIISFIESIIQHTGLALFERNSNGKIEKIIKEIEEYERKYNFQLPQLGLSVLLYSELLLPKRTKK